MPVTVLIDECFTSFNAEFQDACRLFVDRILAENNHRQVSPAR